MTIPTLPDNMARLPRDKHGRPVPWFVAWVDGVPDFRVMGGDKITDALRFDLCWVCGRKRGRWGTFVIGPMCAVNRVSAEPPSHSDCATYSAQACPFLVTPRMHRRENRLPEGHVPPAGEMIRRNPGVALLWTSRDWRFRNDDKLFHVGSPSRVAWYAEGRDATRAEVLASIDSGLPILRNVAEEEGRGAVRALEAMHADALRLIPAEEAADA